jgi:hypothetical protein
MRAHRPPAMTRAEAGAAHVGQDASSGSRGGPSRAVEVLSVSAPSLLSRIADSPPLGQDDVLTPPAAK